MRAVDAIVDATSFAEEHAPRLTPAHPQRGVARHALRPRSRSTVLFGRGHCDGNPTLYRVVLSD
jgi:hypothetical protein